MPADIILLDSKVSVPVNYYKLTQCTPFYLRKNKIFAHDEKSKCRIGDLVRVGESPQISKIKHFKILEIIEKGGNKLLSNTKKMVYQYD
ncbi:30S ribosomal protein S17 [Trichoplax sp. H2]|nr:30S ribosomal protein S17 [Trichoplax sp. H2]|eukprot:RDD37580.1 30S ribosomal protein S17 [Trichoplax sp. H2]